MSAPTINFQRVGGSRFLDTNPNDQNINCYSKIGLGDCTRDGQMDNNTGKAAEIVNFPAYLYFTQPFLKDVSVPGGEVETMYVAPPRQ